MDANELRIKIELHSKFLCGEECGEMADFSNEDLSFADFSGADLRSANFSRANLRCANLKDAYFSNANFLGANLCGAKMNGSDFDFADLSESNLSCADLNDADFSGADLRSANLSGTIGLISQSEFMKEFETDDLGWIVYKAIGNTSFSINDSWKISPGEFLTEVCNHNRVDDCGCGVNFASLEWVKVNYGDAESFWKCRIRFEDGPGIVVPYNTRGKARCERLELLEEII